MPLAVCATPIGNLDDVTLRVLEELREADVVLCEDTRVTRGLLERHGIKARLLEYHEHNEAKRTRELLPRLEAGERMALVTDAGLPGVSDPGARLIAAALDAGVPVTVLPGASSVDTALVASGLGAERFQFVGFLPRGERALRELWDELARWPHAVVAFESPQRLPRTLRSLAAAMPERPTAVCAGADEVLRGARAGDGRGRLGALRGAAEGGGRARARAVGDGRCGRRFGRGSCGRGRRGARRGGRVAPAGGRARLAPDGRVPKCALRALSVTKA